MELSLHSWSDMEHHFKELRVRANDTAWAMVPKEKRHNTRFDDHKHGWVRGSRVTEPRSDEVRRVADAGEHLRFVPYGRVAIPPGQPTPHALVVTSLVVRRQFYHNFPSRYLLPMMRLLPNLVHFKYEPVHNNNRSEWEDLKSHMLIELGYGGR